MKRKAHLGKAGVLPVSVVLSVSVEGTMLCHMRVDDVFCAVPLSGTVRSAMSVLAETASVVRC